MKILIPMGGRGLRFKDSGYTIPKPLLEINGRPMIAQVLSSIDVEGDFIYVVRKDHVDNFQIQAIINDVHSGQFVVMSGENEGQAQTCLLAKDLIDDDEPLLIINCDNYFIWDSNRFLELVEDDEIDGAIFTFTDNAKKTHWCFAELDGDRVVRLAEKEPISDIALAGGFYWRKGSDFVKYAEGMISQDIRAKNGEFYLGSVYNEAIGDQKNIVNFQIDMKSLGTPEELRSFHEWLLNESKMESEMNRNIKNAIDDLRAGKPIVLIDEHDRENEGDIVLAAEKASVENLVFTMNEARGLMCIPCDGSILDRLAIGPMVPKNTDKNQTPFTVSVDAVDTSTGMSVHDRLKTIAVMVSEDSSEADLNRPGHLFPLRPRDGLLKDRRGHTEGSIELMRLAGLKPVSIICEIMNDDGSMAKGGQINKFATEHGLTLISIEELYETVYGQSL